MQDERPCEILRAKSRILRLALTSFLVCAGFSDLAILLRFIEVPTVDSRCCDPSSSGAVPISGGPPTCYTGDPLPWGIPDRDAVFIDLGATMAALTLDALAARLELLERENARLNRATRCLKMWLGMILTLGLGAVSAGAALQQQPSPITPELRTERLVVVDRLGRSRVELSVGIDGKASLNFLDKAQKVSSDARDDAGRPADSRV